MDSSHAYRIVTLANGTRSVHSRDHSETFHPVIGPVAEAEALYVRQLQLTDRVKASQEEFVIWDVGLGAAANALTVLRATSKLATNIRIVSFDHTAEPLAFALEHAEELGYFEGYQQPLRELLASGQTRFKDGNREVHWKYHLTDFPTFIAAEAGNPKSSALPRPHAILFDAFSPAKNPAMWTGPLFASIYKLLDPQRPCAMPTYSRSTILRVSLLLAGFFVGAGHATGEKEETTIATNQLQMLVEPLDRMWLAKAKRSTSAEPLWEPIYRQAPLTAATWEKLCEHPQFR
ncbi:MAG TPA: MnmC family methyltransferase [Candidatus Saccharimonadales bacterium]|nr:MnmC family methyltransferase [Candidatus Saccharimonadales bacterium]